MSAFDQAGDISMMTPPAFDSETLMKVFVPCGGEAMKREFERWAGKVEFSSCPDGCGTVIFSSPASPWVTTSLANALRPFFAKGGTECHTFEYDVVRKVFVRRGPDWLEEPGRVVAT